jgi:hypothetical protein
MDEPIAAPQEQTILEALLILDDKLSKLESMNQEVLSIKTMLERQEGRWMKTLRAVKTFIGLVEQDKQG